MTPFRLAHLSDPHLPPPADALRVRPSLKQRLSRLAWRRKSHEHQPEVLAALVADIRARAPDHIALTGDLTNFSAPGEIAAAGRWLKALAAPSDLTLSPGNHDALSPAGPDRWDAWAPWLGEGEQFPRVRIRGQVAIINLCSAVPTPIHLAQGALGQDQLARLGEALRTTGARGLFRVVLIHHPPSPGLVSRRKSLVDAQALAAIIADAGAELVLHGHTHESSVSTIAGPIGPVPVLGVPSASAAGHLHARARWHELEITAVDGRFQTRVTARGQCADGAVGELGRYVLITPQRM